MSFLLSQEDLSGQVTVLGKVLVAANMKPVQKVHEKGPADEGVA